MYTNNEISQKLTSLIELVNRQDRTEETMQIAAFLTQAQRLVTPPAGQAAQTAGTTPTGIGTATTAGTATSGDATSESTRKRA